MMSIRKKLITSILTVLFVVTFLLALVTYFSIREEMDEFYDENLKQVAHTILSTGPTASTSRPTHIEIDSTLRGEEEYLTQVWKNGILQYSSHPHVKFPLQEGEGKGRAAFNESTWRFYKETNGDISIQLSQDLKERHSIVVEIYGFLLIPIIIQFPILAGLIWIMIGRGMKPLGDISNLIKNRNPSFLEPLTQDNVPIEINTLIDALNELLSRLQQALEIQKQFTADAAHELRTPLTAVRLQLDILKRAEDENEAKIALITLENGILRSTRLVEQLLELARQEPENTETPFTKVDLAHVVTECIEQIKPIAKEKNISIISKLIAQPIITGNAPKLAVMVGNLINNAVTYTNKNGHIEVVLRHENNKIVLDIADNGIGISAQDRDRVFDRFYRVAGTGTTGSGLGLSIVRSVAELHKATVRIDNGIGGVGTTFRVYFQPI